MNTNYGISAPTGVRSEEELKRLQAMLRPRAATGVWSREDQSAYDAYLKKEAADPFSYRVYGYEPPAMVSNRARVESMQDILGVKVDGLWGPETQAAYDARRQEEAALRTQQARGERGLVPLQGGVDDGYVSTVPDGPMTPNRVYAERDKAAALAKQYRGTLGSTTLQGGVDDNYVSSVPDGSMIPNRVKAGDLAEKVYQSLLGVAQQKSGEAGRMAMNEERAKRLEANTPALTPRPQYQENRWGTVLQGGVDDGYVSTVPEGPVTPNRVKAGDLAEKVYQSLLGVAQQKSGEAGRMAMNEERTERKEKSFSTSEMRFETEAQAKAFYQPLIEEAWEKYLASVKFLGRQSRQKWQVDSNSASLYKEYTELKQSLEQAIIKTRQDMRRQSELTYPFYTDYNKINNPFWSSVNKGISETGQELWYSEEQYDVEGLMDLALLGAEYFPPKERNLLHLFVDVGKLDTIANTFEGAKHYESNLTGLGKIEHGATQGTIANPFSNDGFIVRQNRFNGGNANSQQNDPIIRYGKSGTINGNGCGAIAAYNALKILQPTDYPTFADVIRQMEPGAMAFGKLGSDPFYIAKYFRRKGYDVEIHYTKETMEQAASEADMNIYVYIYHRWMDDQVGAHFVAMQPLGNDEYRYFNGKYDAPDYEIGGVDYMYNSQDLLRLGISIKQP